MADGQRQVFHPPRLPGVRMLGRYSQRSAHGGLPPHSHRGCVEICLLEKGRQAYRVDGRVYRMKGGDQFVTFPDEKHDSAGGPQEKGVLYWVIVDLRPRPRGFLFLEPTASRALAAALRRMPTRHFRAVPGARAALDRAFASLSAPTPHDPLRLLTAAQALADYLLKTVEAARTGAIQQVSPRIGAALDRIAAREEEWLSVSALAEEVGLSAPRFKVRFREETGVPPGEYMLRRKVELARARLAGGRATITEIAHALGFASSQYFATVFRRYTGLTPSQESRRIRRRAGTGRTSPAGSSRSAS